MKHIRYSLLKGLTKEDQRRSVQHLDLVIEQLIIDKQPEEWSDLPSGWGLQHDGLGWREVEKNLKKWCSVVLVGKVM